MTIKVRLVNFRKCLLFFIIFNMVLSTIYVNFIAFKYSNDAVTSSCSVEYTKCAEVQRQLVNASINETSNNDTVVEVLSKHISLVSKLDADGCNVLGFIYAGITFYISTDLLYLYSHEYLKYLDNTTLSLIKFFFPWGITTRKLDEDCFIVVWGEEIITVLTIVLTLRLPVKQVVYGTHTIRIEASLSVASINESFNETTYCVINIEDPLHSGYWIILTVNSILAVGVIYLYVKARKSVNL